MTAAMAPFAGFIHDPDGQFDVAFAGIIRRGHGVASGSAVASPYAEGTLALQIPIFLKLGATCGASIAEPSMLTCRHAAACSGMPT